MLVEFFSSEGQRLGDKVSLEQSIHQITGIPFKALQNGPLDDFTISERKEWAENRETSEEDSFYCLLGILDVFMPTSYGEGKEKSWRRLQLEVEAIGTALSIIPFFRNEKFVGRRSELVKMEGLLFNSKQATSIAVIGPRGAGKS